MSKTASQKLAEQFENYDIENTAPTGTANNARVFAVDNGRKFLKAGERI